MATTTFEVDQFTLDAINELRSVFDVRSAAQVVRKALALARVIARYASCDGTITILGRDGEELLILLIG